MHSPHLPFWLAAVHLPETGPRTVLRWLEHFTDIQALFAAHPDERRAAGIPARHDNDLRQPDWESVEADLDWAALPSQHLICFDDAAYPPLLREIHDPPLVLYVRGNREALAHPQVAIVGSRHASYAGLEHAERFAYSLAEAGLTITSGLALGVDGAAHNGVLNVPGETIAVMGTGMRHIYPHVHRPLADKIVDHDGALVTEFPLAMPPHAHHFPRRNRIIGGLSMGVLVVEAALKSGSLITARHAMEQGREVFAIPGSIHHPLARGCHHLIRQGAKLVETAQDVLEELRGFCAVKPARQVSQTAITVDLSPEDRCVYEQIGYELSSIDMIILHSGLTAGEVSSILLSLELRGFIQAVPGGYTRAAPTVR